MTEPTPPEPLTPAEAGKLVAWLNFAAAKWPRLVGTLALARVPVNYAEFGDAPAWDEPPCRPPNVHMNGTEMSVGVAELLSAFFPGTASLWAKFTAAGMTFEATGLPR